MGGAQMAARATLAEALRTATSRQGAKMFDPSVIIAQYGRKASLAKEGNDFFHYNPELHETIANALLDAAHLEKRLPRSQRYAVELAGDQVPEAETRPIAAAAKRINDTLLRVHRDRVEALGVDRSGLYQHYKRLLDEGRIAG
ncbi:MAG: hypothetical protein ACRD9W_27465, partial [Terriglobia bacterium]